MPIAKFRLVRGKENRSPPSSGHHVFHKRTNDQNRLSPLLRPQRGLKNGCLSFVFFFDSFQEIAFGRRFLRVSAGLSISFVIIFYEIAFGRRFYFNFAPIDLAESHVKPHLFLRGFLETVNGEWKSAKKSLINICKAII